jgi:hypothetical protein
MAVYIPVCRRIRGAHRDHAKQRKGDADEDARDQHPHQTTRDPADTEFREEGRRLQHAPGNEHRAHQDRKMYSMIVIARGITTSQKAMTASQ